jgi:uncharacterized protein (DUF849 family)
MEVKRELFPGTNEAVLRKVIITAAITGAVHTPAMSDYLPLTPKQIADDAVRACEAGAAMVHIHARIPETGEPTPDLKIFREILTDIKERCNAVIIVTTGGAGTIEERIAVVPEFKPEMATLNCGSLSMIAIDVWERLKDKIKFDWEHERLKREDRVFTNTYEMLRKYSQIDRENNTKPELEIWDVGQIGAVRFMLEHGYIDRPIQIQFVMGSTSGMPATVDTLVFVLQETRRQLGDSTWAVCVAGRDQFPIAVASLAMGGNVRVGMEDNLYCGYGRMTKSSAEQVERVVKIARELSLAPATPDDARNILGLKGLDKVNF